jgi:hypothetical protein
VFSEITKLFPKSIHAVAFDGFLLKLSTLFYPRKTAANKAQLNWHFAKILEP